MEMNETGWRRMRNVLEINSMDILIRIRVIYEQYQWWKTDEIIYLMSSTSRLILYFLRHSLCYRFV